VGLGCFFNFLTLCLIGKTPWTGYQPVGKLLRTQRTTKRVGFEITTAVFERAKMVHALDHTETVIDNYDNIRKYYGFVSNSVHYYGDVLVTSYSNLNKFCRRRGNLYEESPYACSVQTYAIPQRVIWPTLHP
jgi:hypothetical protein